MGISKRMGVRVWSPRSTRWSGLKTFTVRMGLRFLVLAALVGVYHLLDLHLRYRNALHAKYSPTHFTMLSHHDDATLASPGWEVDAQSANADRRALLGNRRRWRRLGKGREGEAFTFDDSVIKIYNEESSPFRNCMPGTTSGIRRWPTEIPASLIVGGGGHRGHGDNHNVSENMFVPVKDYFLAPTDPTRPPKWHLVTPFLKSGTASTLARKLRHSRDAPSYHEVDATFRPSFESLVSALDDLHRRHNLCHDDVKLDNIFVASEADPRRWKMGDLGNAREPEHPYHSTPLWVSDTPQLRDCRANDVLRLTKSYLRFVRIASRDPGSFDRAFLRGLHPVSRMYWSVVGAASASPLSAADVRELSKAYPPPAGGGSGGAHEEALWAARRPAETRASWGWTPVISALLGWERPLASVVTKELRVGANEGWGKTFGLSGILGIPVTACRAS